MVRREKDAAQVPFNSAPSRQFGGTA